MRAVFALVLLIGMALAGGAVFLAKSYLGQQEAALVRATEQSRQTGPLVRVYAVKKPMEFGAPLTAADVQEVFLQKNLLPKGVFFVNIDGVEGAKPLFANDDDKPRYLRRSMEANEVLLEARVTEPGEMATLTGKLEAGMRAFQIRVESSGVQRFVLPDAYIDVYWSGSTASGEVTRMIESAMRVLAVDGASGEGQQVNGDARTITVAATPEQVARLAQAQATGRLSMSLVGSAEDAVQGLVEIDRNALLGVVKEEVVQAEQPQVCTIKTRKGDAVVEVPIPCTN